ncbi:cell division protein ZapE [Pseudomonas stutzeri]|uniref:cell division protein ZapE n=1 Tax=Stutzerimonas stutzeri TaxID=316 RepID=UPI00210BC41A|nr:cell division protein ZapE [Stutzerimonas stutzeri]MCQ4306458.1 cell division protein ZapE [Stutzerimonas stutzeri]
MTSDVLQGARKQPGEPVARQVEQAFEALLASRGYRADPAQKAAIELLARWLDGWLRGRRGWLRASKSGVYLWGGVGRGKSFVMDAFYAAAPVEAKRRVHFHAFLQYILERLKQITGRPDPLALIAREIAADTRLLCFDEFHVHDIGDAMLLGRLLQHLVEQGIGIVATSNYPPRALCPNPLYRDRFKPAIELIEHRFEIYNLDGGQDYRQRAESGYVWGEFARVAAEAQAGWVERRLQLPASAERDVRGELNHRPLCLQARHQATAWLAFDELCRLPRSSADFVWLSRTFERLAVTGVPLLDEQGIDVQQRFLNLIDILYDSGVELLLAAEANPQALLSAGAHVDFARTRSRLQQLRVIETEGSGGVHC